MGEKADLKWGKAHPQTGKILLLMLTGEFGTVKEKAAQRLVLAALHAGYCWKHAPRGIGNLMPPFRKSKSFHRESGFVKVCNMCSCCPLKSGYTVACLQGTWVGKRA